MGIISGAAVSEVALALSLARPMVHSQEVLKYYCCDISSVVRPFNAKEILALLPSPVQLVKAELKWKRQGKVSARSYADDRNNSCTWISGRRTAASC